MFRLPCRDVDDVEEQGEADRTRSSRPKNCSLSEDAAENVLDFPNDRARDSPGEGLRLKGNRCPLRSPRPDKGVGTRLISRACSRGGGIRIGSGLEVVVVADTDGFE